MGNISKTKNKVETSTTGSKMKLFDLIYLLEEHALFYGRRIVDLRMNYGSALAKIEWVRHLDVVIPIPETAIPFAMGYAKEANLPFCYAVYKKRPKQKTLFIPNREKVVQDIFFIIPELIKGKNIVIVDEAVISGMSLKVVLDKIKKAKPKSIHVRVVALMSDIEDPEEFFGVDTFQFLEKEI